MAEYTVSASYGTPAAGSSIPEGLSSRSAVATFEFKLAEGVRLFTSMQFTNLLLLLIQVMMQFSVGEIASFFLIYRYL
jgi:hypothetical protein